MEILTNATVPLVSPEQTAKRLHAQAFSVKTLELVQLTDRSPNANALNAFLDHFVKPVHAQALHVKTVELVI